MSGLVAHHRVAQLADRLALARVLEETSFHHFGRRSIIERAPASEPSSASKSTPTAAAVACKRWHGDGEAMRTSMTAGARSIWYYRFTTSQPATLLAKQYKCRMPDPACTCTPPNPQLRDATHFDSAHHWILPLPKVPRPLGGRISPPAMCKTLEADGRDS